MDKEKQPWKPPSMGRFSCLLKDNSDGCCGARTGGIFYWEQDSKYQCGERLGSSVWYIKAALPHECFLCVLIIIYNAFIQVIVAWSQIFILDQSRKIEMSKSLWSFTGQRCTIFKKTRVALCWDIFFVLPSHWLLELCRITHESIKISYFYISENSKSVIQGMWQYIKLWNSHSVVLQAFSLWPQLVDFGSLTAITVWGMMLWHLPVSV